MREKKNFRFIVPWIGDVIVSPRKQAQLSFSSTHALSPSRSQLSTLQLTPLSHTLPHSPTLSQLPPSPTHSFTLILFLAPLSLSHSLTLALSHHSPTFSLTLSLSLSHSLITRPLSHSCSLTPSLTNTHQLFSNDEADITEFLIVDETIESVIARRAVQHFEFPEAPPKRFFFRNPPVFSEGGTDAFSASSQITNFEASDPLITEISC